MAASPSLPVPEVAWGVATQAACACEARAVVTISEYPSMGVVRRLLKCGGRDLRGGRDCH